MSYDFEQLGRRIAEQRKKFRKVSQEKMAEDLGFYQADVSNLEHAKKGSGIADLSKLDLIADYFDVPLESLLFGIDRKNMMLPYFGAQMQVTRIDPNKKIVKKHLQKLEVLIGQDPQKAISEQFLCGPYKIYVGSEDQLSFTGKIGPDGEPELDFVLPKLHFFVFLNDDVISSMAVDVAAMAEFIYQPYFEKLQDMIQPDVFHVADALRIFNPYIPLTMFEENPEEQKKLQQKLYERMDELRAFQESFVLFIENVYVCEDCRKMGIFRMMLDTLSVMSGDCTIWLNMEPTAGDELTQEYDYFPMYTASDVGQLNINAAIAEKLGFTVDPDCWHREAEVIDHEGHKVQKVIEVRKCAYKLATGVREIIKNDGDLVDIGRAKQKIMQADDPGDGAIADFTDGVVDGKRVIEIRIQDDGRVTYVSGTRDQDGKVDYCVTRQSVLRNGFNIEKTEEYENIQDANTSEFINELTLISTFMKHT